MSRKTARKHAFKLIYQFPFNSEQDGLEAMELYYDHLNCNEEKEFISKRDTDFINTLFSGVLNKMPELDEKISEFLTGWSIDRIGKVDLAILRLALFEMLFISDIPTGVSVNEAVELAKEFGLDESPAYINGILGQVIRRYKL